jgi:uncharacterized protein (TIGR02246 family)
MEKIMFRYAFLTAAVAAAALMPVSAEAKVSRMTCTTASPAQISGLFDKFNAAWATKNPATVTSLFTKNAVLLATVSNKPRVTPAEVEDYFVGFLKKDPVGVIDTSTIRMGCNDISRVGTWTVTVTNHDTGARVPLKARYSFIYKMENGQWKIDHLHSSLMPEPTS